MSNYNISATLTLRDRFTAKVNSAMEAAKKLTQGVGDAKNKDLMWRIGVQGMEQLKRYNDLLRQAGMTQPKPVNLRVNDNGATSKLQNIKSQVLSLASRPYNVMVNIKTNGMAALRNAKAGISEMATGAAMGMGAGMMGVAGVGFGAVNMIDTYKDFEYQMKRNKALFTTGLDAATAEKQYQDLENAARHYGSIMKFTAAEVGKAEEYMALAGWTSQQAIDALPAVLNAAVASGEDLALVSDIITDDMTAMGYKAGTFVKNALGQDVEAAQHFADVMLRTTLRSNTNFQQLGLAMKYAAPLAHTLGYNIEEVAVAMGLMANNGIKADQAGTGLRGILNRFINMPKKAALAMDQLGVSLFDASGNAKGLMTTLMDVRAALKGKDVDAMIDFAEEMTGEQVENRRELTDFLKEAKARGGGTLSEKDQARLGSMLSGTYAMAAFMAIMNSSDEDIKKLMEEIYHKSDGTGAAIQAEMLDTLQGDLDTMKSAWEDFNVELFKGDGASGLRSFIQGLTKDINQFKTSLKDGLDFGDIGKLGITVLDQLKDKFLQLDGIGSILAGGALFMAMKKMLSMGLKIKDTLSAWSKVRTAGDLGNILRGNQGGIVGTSQVGTMHVNAGVVNLTGAVKGMPPATGQPARTGGVITSTGQPARTGGVITTGGVAPRTTGGINPAGSIATAGAATAASSILLANRSGRVTGTLAERQQTLAARNGAYVNDYYARRGAMAPTPTAIPPTTTPIPPSTVATGAMGTLRAAAPAIGGAGILAGLFGALDIYSAKSHSEMTMQEARETLQYQKNVLASLQEQGASQESLARQMQEVADAEAFVERTRVMNQNAENQAMLGAGGAVAGALAGAAIGSFVPVIGTAIGGMIGGILGQLGGIKLAEYGANARAQRQQQQGAAAKESAIPNIAAGSMAGFRQGDEGYLGQVQTDEYKQQQAELQRQRQQAETPQADNALRDNAAAMTRRQTLNRLEGEGISINDIPSYNATKRHSLEYWQVKDDEGNVLSTHRKEADMAAERQATFKYDQEYARGESLAKQREEYNKRWQMQFGGTSLAGQANFVPDTEEDRKALALYDEVQANKQRQKDLVADIKAKGLTDWKWHGGSGGIFEETPKKADWQAQWDKPQEDFKTTSQLADEARAKSETSFDGIKKFFGGIGDFLDGLLFNKAAASAIKPETVTELSTPETSPVKPQESQGLFDFELPELPNIGEWFSNFEFPNIGEKLGGLFEGIELPNIGEKLSGLFEGIEPPNIGEWFTNFELPDIGGKITEMFSSIEPPDISGWFASIELPELGITEKLYSEFDNAGMVFETFSATAMTTFSGLAGTIGGALAGVGSAITSVFSSAASEVQGIWGAMPGFFGGVFGSLGGVASAAGGAIASGLTGVIGGIIGAWQGAAATISGIIANIASAASAAASAAGNFFGGGVGSNAIGTASWKGGWTEVNEHGGELMNLPKGTKIYPHATTVNILKHEIRRKLDDDESTSFRGLKFADYGLDRNEDFSRSTTNFLTSQNNILGGDNLSGGIPKINISRGGNITSQIGDWLLGGRRKRAKQINDSPLGGDILTGNIPRINLSTGGNVLGQIGDWLLGGRRKRAQQIDTAPLSGDILTQMSTSFSTGFDDNTQLETLNEKIRWSDGDLPSTSASNFEIPMPNFELPKSATSMSNSTSNSSNTINFGGVNITNGADFDEFVFRIQQLMSMSSANSEFA